MKPTSIVERLNKYEFHDMVVESISLNDDNGIQLVITALPYNDELEVYERLKITFSKIVELKTDEFFFSKESEIELNSFSYEYREFYDCKMIFLLGSSNPGLTIYVKCEIVELEE